ASRPKPRGIFRLFPPKARTAISWVITRGTQTATPSAAGLSGWIRTPAPMITPTRLRRKPHSQNDHLRLSSSSPLNHRFVNVAGVLKTGVFLLINLHLLLAR